MKRLKKIGIALVLVVAVLSIGIFAALGASNMFTGTVYRLGIYVKDMEKVTAEVEDGNIPAINELDKMLTEIETYLFEKPVNPEEEGYEELDAKIKNAKILIVNKALSQVENLTDPLEQSSFLGIASKWFDNTPYTDEEMESQSYIDTKNLIATTGITVATSLYNDINADNFNSDVEKDIATEGVKLKRLRTFLSENAVNQDSEQYVDYIEIYNDYLEMWNLYQTKMAERYTDLTISAPLSEYGLGNGMSTYHFENNQKAPGLSNASKENADGVTRTVKSVTETETYLDANGATVTNSYLTLHWPVEGDVGINAYITPSYTGCSYGAVIEFDITTFGTFVNGDLNFGNRRTDADKTNLGGDTTAMLCTINANGDLLATVDGTKKVVFEDVITPGQWTRVSAVIDPKYPEQTQLYIDYCYVATINSNLHGSAPSNLRIGNSSISSGEFSIDNFSCQIGTWFRNDNYINSLVDNKDKLEFYTNYMLNEDNKIPDRMVAYNGVKDLISNYAVLDDDTGLYNVLPTYADDEKISGCVESFNSFDATEMINEYKQLNLEKLAALRDQLNDIGKGLSTVSKRQSKVDEINTFITNNASYIAEGTVYNDILAYVGVVQSEIAMDNSISTFITTMDGFSGTSNVNLLNKKYDDASLIIENLDLSLLNEEGYEKFLDAYNVYLSAKDVIAEQVTVRNSRDIVTYVNYISELYPNESDWKILPVEGDNLTESEIKQNEKFNFISDYITKIRKLIKEGYSVKYTGIDGAVQKFELMDAHYYDLLQLEYAEYYETVLDEFAASDSYIVKKGLIAHLDRYKIENDVDVTHPTIAPLETRFNAYKDELDYQIDSYADILRQNSVYFANYVKLFDTAITYSEKKELYDNATEFYYLMNASGDGVEEAIRIYDAMTVELALVENASTSFISAVELMKLTENQDVYYSYIVDAMSNYPLIDSSFEGVAAAIEDYNEALAAYNAMIGTANGEICEIGESLGSLRANCGLSAIISVIIEKLFSF